MKNTIPIWIVSLLFTSCTTANKMANESFHHALIGQNESTIYSRLGPPAKIHPGSDGGKIMIYEHYSKGMFLTPYKSKVTYSARTDISGNREGLAFHSGVNTMTNDPKYTIYQKNTSVLEVFLDKNGNCVRFNQNLPRELLETYHERFKHFFPETREGKR